MISSINKRQDNISLLRIVVMIFVVFFHSLGYYTYGWPFDGTKVLWYDSFCIFINNIDMPMFAILSGYLYGEAIRLGKYTNKWIVLKKKCKHLLLPYFFWTIFQLIIFPSTTRISMIWTGCLHLWFLLMLFILFVIAELTRDSWVNFGKTTSLIILLILLFVPIFLPKIDILCIGSMLIMAVYFYAGIVNNIIPKLNLSAEYLLLFVFLVLLAGLAYHYGRSPLSHTLILQRISSLGTIVLFLRFTKNFKIYKDNVFGNFFCKLDRNSMGIYILHHIMIWGFIQVECIKPILNEHNIIMPILMFFGSFVISLILMEIVFRNKFLGLLIG